MALSSPTLVSNRPFPSVAILALAGGLVMPTSASPAPTVLGFSSEPSPNRPVKTPTLEISPGFSR